MLTKKQQRLRRARQTRIRIATQGVCTPDRQSHQPAHLRQCDFWRWWQGVGHCIHCRSRSSQSFGCVIGKGGNVAAAQIIGKRVAEKAKAAGVEKVAFDRSGFAYHGRVKALADAAREAGLQF
jgi:large subunit ribosomal protein L18